MDTKAAEKSTRNRATFPEASFGGCSAMEDRIVIGLEVHIPVLHDMVNLLGLVFPNSFKQMASAEDLVWW